MKRGMQAIHQRADWIRLCGGVAHADRGCDEARTGFEAVELYPRSQHEIYTRSNESCLLYRLEATWR